MTTNVSMLAMLDPAEAPRATELVKVALSNSGIGRRELKAALQRGLGLAMYAGPPSGWGSASTDRAGTAAGRLLLVLARDLMLPLEGMVVPTAVGVAEELLI